MLILLLDEFGDFSISYKNGLVNESHPSWRPICGYGGVLIPAENYKSFCDEFLQLLTIGHRNIGFAKQSQLTNQSTLSYAEYAAQFNHNIKALFSKEQEVKGKDFFSTSYINSAKPAKKRFATVRRAQKFISIIGKHGGKIFYAGIEKSKYTTKYKSKPPRDLHVNLVKDVLESAYAEAKVSQSQIKIIFDHHSVDDETIERLKLNRGQNSNPSAIARLQTRKEYCQEIILHNKMYDFIREPAYNVESHWSLGIQAADWTCSLLGKTLAFNYQPDKFFEYKSLSDNLNERIEKITSKKSMQQGVQRNPSAQLEMFPKKDHLPPTSI